MTDTSSAAHVIIENSPKTEENIKSESNDQKRDYVEYKYYIRFIYPSNLTGLVVGKGGSKVKALRDKYSCDIHIKETKGPERIIRFKGDNLEDIASCMKEISESWQMQMQKVIPKLREDQTEVRLIVHKNQAGPIIGKKGEGIKKLRKAHDCLILMHGDCLPRSKERVCQIAGKSEDIRNVLIEVIDLSQSIKVDFDKEEWYNPNNYNNNEDYGGYKDRNHQQNNHYSKGDNNDDRDRYQIDHSNNIPRSIAPPIPGWAPPPGQPLAYSTQPSPYQQPPQPIAYQPIPVHYPPPPNFGAPSTAYIQQPPPQMVYSNNFGGNLPQYQSHDSRGGSVGGPQRTRGQGKDNTPNYFRR